MTKSFNNESLHGTIDQIEIYTKQIRGRLIVNKENGLKEKILNWVLGGHGTIALSLICIILAIIFISIRFDIGLELIQNASPKELMLFSSTILAAGGMLYSLVLLIGLYIDTFSGGMLLKYGFSYIKWDYSLQTELIQYLEKKPINELKIVKGLLEQTPPYEIYTKPLKNTFTLVFSTTIISLFTFLLNVGQENSLLKNLELAISDNKSSFILILEILFACFFLLVLYYTMTSNLYKQKNDRTIKLLDDIIKKNSITIVENIHKL